MINYDGEKYKWLRGLMVFKMEDEVVLVGINFGEIEDKEELLVGINFGEIENKEIVLFGLNFVEEELEFNEFNYFEKDIEKVVEEVKEKFEELILKNKYDYY